MRVGTRGSALALAQAKLVAAAIGGDAQLVTIRTAGDEDSAQPDKAKWVSALERALLDGEIDVAVHSAKDVPAVLAEGTELVAALPREDARDVLCGARGPRIGTASLRRAAQLRAADPEVQVVPLRGNVDTRLRKLAGREADGIVLAFAGLRRLGRESEVSEVLDLVPAAGQGIVVLQAIEGAEAPLPNDEPAWRSLLAERECVRVLQADCDSAVGAHLGPDGVMTAWVGAPDGSAWVRDELTLADGADPGAHGAQVAERLLAAGAGELLRAS